MVVRKSSSGKTVKKKAAAEKKATASKKTQKKVTKNIAKKVKKKTTPRQVAKKSPKKVTKKKTVSKKISKVARKVTRTVSRGKKKVPSRAAVPATRKKKKSMRSGQGVASRARAPVAVAAESPAAPWAVVEPVFDDSADMGPAISGRRSPSTDAAEAPVDAIDGMDEESNVDIYGGADDELVGRESPGPDPDAEDLDVDVPEADW